MPGPHDGDRRPWAGSSTDITGSSVAGAVVRIPPVRQYGITGRVVRMCGPAAARTGGGGRRDHDEGWPPPHGSKDPYDEDHPSE
ncbi:hypothetical protein B0675_34080 [Streptomyces sp. M41(2017)]|nr:hypothetical protein B0675_34080 [Streptomyces sp. M41(2017)]